MQWRGAEKWVRVARGFTLQALACGGGAAASLGFVLCAHLGYQSLQLLSLGLGFLAFVVGLQGCLWIATAPQPTRLPAVARLLFLINLTVVLGGALSSLRTSALSWTLSASLIEPLTGLVLVWLVGHFLEHPIIQRRALGALTLAAVSATLAAAIPPGVAILCVQATQLWRLSLCYTVSQVILQWVVDDELV